LTVVVTSEGLAYRLNVSALTSVTIIVPIATPAPLAAVATEVTQGTCVVNAPEALAVNNKVVTVAATS
jgi:hypothetical protein